MEDERKGASKKIRKSVQLPTSKGEDIELKSQESSTLIRWKESNRRTQYRKSSIPFVDRIAKVRFNRIETCITSLQEGPYRPILGGSREEATLLAGMKSILKKTHHPILIDKTLLTSKTTIGTTLAASQRLRKLTNDEVMLCIGFVGQMVSQFSKAERQLRGVYDILTFPSATSDRVELFGRFKATLMIAMDLIHDICAITIDVGEESKSKKANSDEKGDKANLVKVKRPNAKRRESTNPYIVNSSEMIHVTGLTQNLLTKITNTATVSAKFLKSNKKLTQQWELILKRRASDFGIPNERTRKPIYGPEGMPENVTLYENIAETSYPTEGSVSIVWNLEGMKIATDLDGTTVKVESCEIEDKFEILHTILFNGHDLLKYALAQLEIAAETLKDASLQSCYENVKLRIVELDYDSKKFDPLISLELKKTMCEMAVRKSELLNFAEKLDELVNWSLKMITDLHFYSTQLLHGDRKSDKKYRGLLCGICVHQKFITYQDLLKLMDGLQDRDLWITIPMPVQTQMTVQKLQNAVKMRRKSIAR